MKGLIASARLLLCRGRHRCRRRRRRHPGPPPASPSLHPCQALRGIKNCVIGHRRQKLQYIQLGAVQLLVAALQSGDAAQLVQAAAALGSFAASEQGLEVLLQHGGIPHLLRVLVGSSEEKVVEAAVRALKAVARVSGHLHGDGGRGLPHAWRCLALGRRACWR